MQTSKAQFLRESCRYGYGDDGDKSNIAPHRRQVDQMREHEFPQLRDAVYLDHAGATLYSASQLQRSMEELHHGLFGNPHSHSPLHTTSSDGSTASRIDAVRRRVLAHFNASEEEYAVVFTSGATAAVKIVGECFPWSSDSTFAHAMNSHTSVLGLRALATQRGAVVQNVPLDKLQQMEASVLEASKAPPSTTNDTPSHLFAFPAECNFSGTLHNLDLIAHVQNHGLSDVPDASGQWLVLLDAAKFVGTHNLDLHTYKPDFVVLSFYKMMGYPTGVGGLLVHRQQALPLLEKRYYGGGTVANILASSDFVKQRDGKDATRFEDGTVSFLSLLALRHGLDVLEKLTMAAIETHTAALAQLLRAELQSLQHWNGVAAAQVYGDPANNKGSVVTFNFRRADGSFVGYAEVGKLAAIHNIHLRTGCFCNPGACQWYLGLKENDLLDSMAAGHVCGDDVDLVNGVPTGAVRLSVGYMSTYEDVEAFMAFAVKYFVACAAPVSPVPVATKSSSVVLRKLVLFPIKSCSGMSVEAWPVGSRGLLYDREWAILDPTTRKALTLKDAPDMCFLEPVVDLEQQTLTIHCRKSQTHFTLPLYATLSSRNKDEDAQDMRVCAASCKGRNVSDDASAWLSKRLERACRLVRVAAERARSATSASPSADTKIGFANQAQFLLISRPSVAHVNASLVAAGADLQIREDAFRANLIVDAADAFAEDAWTRLRIGDVALDVTGPCPRCSMVNIDPVTGAFHRAPLQVLSRYRRERSSIFFGQFLALLAADDETVAPRIQWLRCGTPIDVEVGAGSS